jgi:hypothetical protein
MTFSEIVKMALTHLEYGTDDDAFATFNERFMIYANEAVRIIAEDLKMTRVVEIALDDGILSFDYDLLRENFGDEVTKIEEVYVMKGRRKVMLPFVQGGTYNEWKVFIPDPNETVSVRYRYVPAYVTDGDAVPAIPEPFHQIIYLYIVHCHHNTRSTSSDYDRTKWLQSFTQQRKRLMKQAYGALDTYQIRNKPWQTGEM